MVILVGFLLALAVGALAQSACPDVLRYEDRQADRYFGRITFPPGPQRWLFMTIVLDKKADLLGNSLGEVTTRDNLKYRIMNPLPNASIQRDPIKFFVKHKANEGSPIVLKIRLDEREICSYTKPVSEGPGQDQSAGTKITNNEAPVTEPEAPGPEQVEDVVQCGTVKLNNPVTLVVDGAPTLEGQWPWQTALYKSRGVNYQYICGGTLVSHRHVISAAHCVAVKNSRPAQKVDENTIVIYLGIHDLVTSVTGVQVRFLDKITLHPDYDTRTSSQDLSILQLQEPVEYSNWIQPACLWPDLISDINFVVGKKGSVVGWGNNGSGQLQLIRMPVVSQLDCINSKPEFYYRVISKYTFCAGLRNGSSTCNGDSGGGMVFPINGAWNLRGVVSLALSKENEPVCDPLNYIVFTDIAQFLPWIRQNIEPY